MLFLPDVSVTQGILLRVFTLRQVEVTLETVLEIIINDIRVIQFLEESKFIVFLVIRNGLNQILPLGEVEPG